MHVDELVPGGAYAFTVRLAFDGAVAPGHQSEIQTKRRVFVESTSILGHAVLIVRRGNGRRHLLAVAILEAIEPANSAD